MFSDFAKRKSMRKTVNGRETSSCYLLLSTNYTLSSEGRNCSYKYNYGKGERSSLDFYCHPRSPFSLPFRNFAAPYSAIIEAQQEDEVHK